MHHADPKSNRVSLAAPRSARPADWRPLGSVPVSATAILKGSIRLAANILAATLATLIMAAGGGPLLVTFHPSTRVSKQIFSLSEYLRGAGHFFGSICSRDQRGPALTLNRNISGFFQRKVARFQRDRNLADRAAMAPVLRGKVAPRTTDSAMGVRKT